MSIASYCKQISVFSIMLNTYPLAHMYSDYVNRFFNGDSQYYKNEEKAFELFTIGCNYGDVRSIYGLAICYHYGKGTIKDLTKARELYLRAISKADDKEDRESFMASYVASYLEEYQEKGEDALSDLYETGNNHLNGGYESLGLFCLRSLAEQDYVPAQKKLSLYYYSHQSHMFYAEAAKYFCMAANKGDLAAIVDMGNLCYNGQGVEQDYAKAVGWYKEAVSSDYPWAMYNLANCYPQGLIYSSSKVEPYDIKTHCLQHTEACRVAEDLYKKAMEQGISQAKDALLSMADQVFKANREFFLSSTKVGLK